MRISNIIFDLDGMLIDSAALTGAIVGQMLADRGATERADRTLIRRMDAVGGAAMIEAALGVHSSDPSLEIEEFRAIHRIAAVTADLPFPGVRETLEEQAAAGIDKAICSNKPQFLCEKSLSELGLARNFVAIIGSTPERARKPDPEGPLLAIGAVNGISTDTLYCGDSVIDLETAQAAGLDAALVAWGYGTHEAVATRPQTAVLKSMSDLRDAVLQHR